MKIIKTVDRDKKEDSLDENSSDESSLDTVVPTKDLPPTKYCWDHSIMCKHIDQTTAYNSPRCLIFDDQLSRTENGLILKCKECILVTSVTTEKEVEK